MSKFNIIPIRWSLFRDYLFLMLISACSIMPGGITPADAVQKTLESQDYEIALVKRLEKDAVVLYHKPQPEFIPGDPLSPTYPFGFSYVEQRSARWWVREGVSGTFTPEPGAKVIFLLHQIKVGEQDPKMLDPGDASLPVIIFGKVLNQTIDMVEAKGVDGTKITGAISNSMFIIIVADGTIPCALQFLDDQGNVIEMSDLSNLLDWQSSPELIRKVKETCPVLS